MKFMLVSILLSGSLAQAAVCGPYLNAVDARLLSGIVRADDSGGNILTVPPAEGELLAILTAGASGSGREQLLALQGQTTLKGLSGERAAVRAALSGDLPGVSFKVGSAVFADDAFKLQPSFISAMAAEQTPVANVPFQLEPSTAAQTINTWVDKATNGNIKEIINAETAAQLVVAAVGTFTFKGTWKYTFPKENTSTSFFMAADGSDEMVPMMEQTIPEIRALSSADRPYDIARLPYSGDRAAMYIVLPHLDRRSGGFAITPEAALQMALDSGDLDRFASGEGVRTYREELVRLPRFEVSYQNKGLKNVLLDLGVDAIFEPGSLLSMSPDPRLKIAYVRLDAIIKVNEEGTELAGAASAGGVLESVRVSKFEFNRAFAFVVREEEKGTNLMTGVIRTLKGE